MPASKQSESHFGGRMIFQLFISLLISDPVSAATVDCSLAYASGTVACEQIECDEKYQSFLGTWSGPMESLVNFGPVPTYRKYQNTISYDAKDCLKNTENGDTFIVGRQTDIYPASGDLEAKSEEKLLITGKDKEGNPFLRTVDLNTKKQESWQLVYKNDVAVLSIWQIKGIQDGNPYSVQTIDAQDWTLSDPLAEHRRNVTVTLESNGFTRVLVRGYHTKQ